MDHKLKVTGGAANFDAEIDGRYVYCFSNEASGQGNKEVLFNVHGVVYVPEDPANSDPLEKGVKELGEMLNQVKDEQQ